jgi:pimeloyl-ACP methyl ester carboxylesterase
MRALLEKYSYGHTPDCKATVTGTLAFADENSYAGKVKNEKITLTVKTELGEVCYPIELFIPNKVKKPPVFLHLAFRPVPDRYIPVEEITDAGYALAVLVYTDMVNDNHFGDYSDGIAKHFGTDNPREDEEWGKIGMWAWGASRALDYLIENRDDIDTEKVAVIGHSRLGKTALWCAAQDERFAAAISNNSGYGGAASSKHGTGERVTDFIDVGSWDWYCENFKKFAGELEDKKPYDQSFLLALIAPRLLCVGSAIEDNGADPESEFLTTLHASGAWELLGEVGLITPDKMPEPSEHLFDGKVGYHFRHGRHFLSREDWAAYIKFLDKHFKK